MSEPRLPQGPKAIRDLTPQEERIEELLLAGHDYAHIEAALAITERTLRNHLHSIFVKRNVNSLRGLIFDRCDVTPKAKAAGV